MDIGKKVKDATKDIIGAMTATGEAKDGVAEAEEIGMIALSYGENATEGDGKVVESRVIAEYDEPAVDQDAEEAPAPVVVEGDTEVEIEPDEETKAQQKKQAMAEFWDCVRFFCISFLIIYAIFFIFPPYIVDGDSMNNTLVDNAMGFGLRIGSPSRGDIVVFSNDKTMGKDYIKRVIGEPGDTVVVMGEQIYINGKPLDEEYAFFDPTRPSLQNEFMEVELDDDEYFVMGDNRCNSADSRSIGPVNARDIKCRMLFFLWGKK